MNCVAQVDVGAVVVAAQLANWASWPAEAAQAATASALSSNWEALRPWTSREFASIEKPRAVGSLNTVATGALPAASLKMLWMLAVNSGALRRQTLRGPGALLVQGSGGLSALGGAMTVGPASGSPEPPSGPVELEPPPPVELPPPELPEP